MSERHNVAIVEGVVELAHVYRAWCDCGYAGSWGKVSAAISDGVRHEEEAAAQEADKDAQTKRFMSVLLAHNVPEPVGAVGAVGAVETLRYSVSNTRRAHLVADVQILDAMLENLERHAAMHEQGQEPKPHTIEPVVEITSEMVDALAEELLCSYHDRSELRLGLEAALEAVGVVTASVVNITSEMIEALRENLPPDWPTFGQAEVALEAALEAGGFICRD